MNSVAAFHDTNLASDLILCNNLNQQEADPQTSQHLAAGAEAPRPLAWPTDTVCFCPDTEAVQLDQ